MNVLLITFSFPPAGGVGVLRALSLARYLPEHGIRVDVLTARNAPAVGSDLALLQQVPAAVTVHRTWTLDLPFRLRKAIKKLLSRRGSATAGRLTGPVGPDGAASLLQSALSRLRGLLGDLLLPDPQIGWLPFALPAAQRLVRARAIDVVLITVPPFSSVRLATQLRKAFPGLPVVVDFRDEWLTTTLSLVSFSHSERARRVARRTEAEAVRAATAVVAVTQAAANELRARYPDAEAAKFHCIPNGFESPTRGQTDADAGAQTGPLDADRRIVFTYIGSLYGSTDPGSFLQAVAGLSREVRDRLRIRFIGRVESEAYQRALEALPGTVETVGFLPQAQALQELRRSDFALLITHDPINVSAKFYDYIGAGIPILAAVHPAGEVRRLLEETQGGWWADINDVSAIQHSLVAAISRQPTEFQPDQQVIAGYHRRPLAARYAQLLTQVVNPQVTREAGA